MPTPEEVQARYRQVLAWREEGVNFVEIGRRLGVSNQRAHDLYRQAQQWPRTTAPASVPHLTADMPLSALPLDPRAQTALERRGVRTVGGVAALSDEELLGIRRIGVGTVQRLRADLASRYRSSGQEAES